MERIYVFLIRNDIWIYILCALGLIWYLNEFWRSRRMLRSAIFGLEKEKGQRQQRRSLVLIILLTIIVSLVLYVNTNIAPTLPPELLKPPTPTPNIFATPLSSPTPDGRLISTPTLGLAPTVTLPNPSINPSPSEANGANETEGSVEEVFTPTTTLADCTPDAIITSPTSGSFMGGDFAIIGTANLEESGSYTLEANGPQTGGTWLPVLGVEGTTPVLEGVLGEVNLSNWLPGLYTLRLAIFNGDGVPTGQCTVEVQLQPASS